MNLENINTPNNALFGGSYSGFQRFDSPKFESLANLEVLMRSNFWTPEEIFIYKKPIDPKIEEIYKNVLCYQTLMDSFQTQNMGNFANIATCPELQTLFMTWSFFENIHSISYSHIIRSFFDDPKEIFDRIDNLNFVKDRMRTEVEFDLNPNSYKEILKGLCHIYCLESLKFQASFYVTYKINDLTNFDISGPCRIIKLINHDEDLHVLGTLKIFEILKKDPNFKNLFDDDELCKYLEKYLKNTFEEEYQFFENLNLHEIIIPNSFKNFMDGLFYNTIQNLQRFFNIQNIEKPLDKSEIKYFNKYKNLNRHEIQLQESDLSVYTLGTLENDILDADW